MQIVKLITFALLLTISTFCVAASKTFESVYPNVCKEGLHKQPSGEFAVYVFCDDAHGSNIAVAHLHPGDSEFKNWQLSKRFWQNEPWSLDVTSIGWVPYTNFLVVTTNDIYGEGSVFLLDLENQKSAVLLTAKDCCSEILAINKTSVTVGISDSENKKPYKKMVLKFPHQTLHSRGMPDSTP
jgi:hypothetical protein